MKSTSRIILSTLAATALPCASLSAAQGLYGSGADAAAMGMGGALAGDPATALESLGANPAGFELPRRTRGAGRL